VSGAWQMPPELARRCETMARALVDEFAAPVPQETAYDVILLALKTAMGEAVFYERKVRLS